jgi:hypothetical protein
MADDELDDMGSHPMPTYPSGTRPSSPLGGRGSPQGWLRRRREARARRRAESGVQRVASRIEILGPQWHIVDYHDEDPDFLAIGPGGVFQVTVCDHGRAMVELAGDVVQIQGQRPPYVDVARRDADRISQQMSTIAGRRIPVIPVLAFLGSGQFVQHGRQPDRCVVTSYREVGRLLQSHGRRIAPRTIEKLVALANRVDPRTVGQYLDSGITPNSQSYG